MSRRGNVASGQVGPKWNSLIVGDALEVMRSLPDGCVDIVFTSPPYNMGISSGGGMKSGGSKWRNPALADGYTGYDDSMPHADYAEWQRKCLVEMMRLIPENGAVFYNHKWRVQNGRLMDRQDIVSGFPVRQIIIWKRQGGINFNNGYFLPTYEVIYLIAKPRFRLRDKKNHHGDVWEIGQERNNPHPAPFPIELAERVISSTDAQSVLDPFVGSGTTALAAKKLGLRYIGIDQSAAYIAMSKARVSEKGRWQNE